MSAPTIPSSSAPRPAWSSPLLRLLLLGVLVMLLLIPLGMIEEVVAERAARRAEAAAEIGAKWGGEQRLVGPLLRISCVYRTQTRDAAGVVQDGTYAQPLYLLPERLDADIVLSTEIRRRGIFQVPVYAAAARLQGSFARPQLEQCPRQALEIDWQRTELVLGLQEPRSVQAEAGLDWNGAHLQFRPATGAGAAPLLSGLHVPLGGAVEPFSSESARFSLALSLNGSAQLQVAPLAKETVARISGDWPHPSFQGGWLPQARELRDDGFDARWSLTYLGRDYPQAWEAPGAYAEAVEKSMFGVALALPVDPYTMAVRVTKYGVLTVLFTFFTVWMTEVLSGGRVHPVQYAFIGAALCLFGLLQLSIAEHLGFTAAFAAAALSVTALVTLYCRSVLRSTRRALGVGVLLGGLYGYLYALLRAEDYALLGGSLALFGLLAAAMYLTRRIDWFATATPGAAR